MCGLGWLGLWYYRARYTRSVVQAPLRLRAPTGCGLVISSHVFSNALTGVMAFFFVNVWFGMVGPVVL